MTGGEIAKVVICGEPTGSVAFIVEIRAAGALCTLGGITGEKVARDLARQINAGCRWVTVSRDSPTPK